MPPKTKLIAESFMGIVLACQLSGCSHISLEPSSAKLKRHTLLTDSVPLPTANPQPQPAQSSGQPQQSAPVRLTGQWRMGFQVENRTLSSTINLTQEGSNFQGEGIDDQTNRHFKVEDGSIKGNQIAFFKRYDGNDMQPVQHTGEFSIINDATIHGPYMGGEYSTGYHGKILTGQWEAALVPANEVTALNQARPASQIEESAPAQVPPAQHNNKAPDLSGKWNVGYEYNFKTIHSVMYLEQDGGKVGGHGIDTETKERFLIPKGWYHYPRLTLIRKYTKGKNLAKSSREMTFKAEVNFVNDRDYQGPYLNGKTQGGGTWEGEMIK